MKRTVIINAVGLTSSMLGEHTPNLKRLITNGDSGNIQATLPGLTCPVQATYLTGKAPDAHGIIANGWYDREYNEIWFWRQSNRLIQAEKIWETAKRIDNQFTCANMFWWYNMATTADYAVTPRPMYPADGRKIPDCYTRPTELRDTLNKNLGYFPLFGFWGPATSIESSRWITQASKLVWRLYDPTLLLVYLPHLDYNLQRLGPCHPEISQDVQVIDQLCGELIDMAFEDQARVLVVSEYSITSVNKPVYINQALRRAGLLNVRLELGLEQLDLANSKAFAVCDHQVANIYINDMKVAPVVKELVASLDGVDRVFDREESADIGLNHSRSGDLITMAESDAWFAYYFWLEDDKAPDYARTVDIHRKPGFDPVELFFDPEIKIIPVSVGWRLLRKKLGFRQLMDVIPLTPELVKGSHGRIHDSVEPCPIIISSEKGYLHQSVIQPTQVRDIMLDHLFG
ncbi:MAG: alkaline phosphatase family protein [Nitrosomonas sp.]|nr:alkaline phosphatase family protein [Nitrosomonas sp.]